MKNKMKNHMLADTPADTSHANYTDDNTDSMLSFIEVKANKKKWIWIKAISLFVAFVFFFQQLGIADIYQHQRTGGVAEELMPSSSERASENRFAPSYLKRQQSKHEDIIKQRMGKEDLMEQLQLRGPQGEEEPMPLKKKQGGGGGGTPEYTMTNMTGDDPHQFNDLQYLEDRQTLERIESFDITRQTLQDWHRWQPGASLQTNEAGEDYWVGYQDSDNPDNKFKISESVYSSDGEKIDYILSGYVYNVLFDDDPTLEKYIPTYITTYTYTGDDLEKTVKYYIKDLEDPEDFEDLTDAEKEDRIIEESIFEGTEDKNKISQRIVYDRLTGDIKERQDFYYENENGDEYADGDSQKALSEVRTYDTSEMAAGEDRTDEGLGILQSITYYTEIGRAHV